MDIYELLGEDPDAVTSMRAAWSLPTIRWSVISSPCANAAG